MNAEQQIDKLHDFLADHVRPAGLTVSEFVTREAEAGNLAARRLLACGLFRGAGSDDPAPAPAPIVPPAVAERAHRILTQQLPNPRKMHQQRESRRPIVQSDRVTPWLPK